jgi:hypothetical protein
MKRLASAAVILLCLTAGARAAWWAENDYTAGSNGLKKESLTLFDNLAPRLVAGVNASFYKDSALYADNVWAVRAPLMYSGEKLFLSLKPFLYPVSGYTRSGAGGAKAGIMLPLGEEDENYLHLTLSGAWAQQRAMTAGSASRKTFTEAAGEAQLEKSFFNQFFFMASAAGFSKPAGVSNATLIKPVMDSSELAYLGTFRPVTALPEWAASAQVARNMRPDFDSHIYAGYSKISYRGGMTADSVTAGIKIGLTEKSSLDLAYNPYKDERAAWKNYFKAFLQIFF